VVVVDDHGADDTLWLFLFLLLFCHHFLAFRRWRFA
jgi:hypothetical protein